MGAVRFPWWTFTSASDYVANKIKSFDIALSFNAFSLFINDCPLPLK